MSFLVAYDDSSSSTDDSAEEANGDKCDLDRTKTTQQSQSMVKLKEGDNEQNSLKRRLSREDSDETQDETPFKKTLGVKMNENDRSQDANEAKAGKYQLRLPSEIQSMFDKNQSWVDNPSEHEFRVRSFPHVEGNWATHVYIPVPQDSKWTSFVNRIMDVFRPLEFHAMAEYHVSLSRTVAIRRHWIESMVDSLRQNLARLQSCLADIVSVKLYANDEKTRTFVCLEVSQEDTVLLDYIKAVDKSFAEFKLPKYYEDPSFHISIGWCVGDVRDRISDDTLMSAKEMLATFCAANPDLSVVFARQICCQSGNKSFLIPLKDMD